MHSLDDIRLWSESPEGGVHEEWGLAESGLIMYCRMQNDKKKMRLRRTNKLCLSSLVSVEHPEQPLFFSPSLDRQCPMWFFDYAIQSFRKHTPSNSCWWWLQTKRETRTLIHHSLGNQDRCHKQRAHYGRLPLCRYSRIIGVHASQSRCRGADREKLAEEMRLSEGGVHRKEGNDAKFLGWGFRATRWLAAWLFPGLEARHVSRECLPEVPSIIYWCKQRLITRFHPKTADSCSHVVSPCENPDFSAKWLRCCHWLLFGAAGHCISYSTDNESMTKVIRWSWPLNCTVKEGVSRECTLSCPSPENSACGTCEPVDLPPGLALAFFYRGLIGYDAE